MKDITPDEITGSRPTRRLPRSVVATLALTAATLSGLGTATLDANAASRPKPKMSSPHAAPQGTSWAAGRLDLG